MKYTLLIRIYLCILSLTINSCNENKIYTIDHVESDMRVLNRYINRPVVRPDIELVNIFDSEYDFQLMNEDEWGEYFDVLRIDYETGNVEVAIQDSIHSFPRKYEFKQFTNKYSFVAIVESLIVKYNIWEIKDTLNKNRITDGGDLSILLKGHKKAKLITWQDFERNESPDKKRAEDFYKDVWLHTSELLKAEHRKYIEGEK